MKRKTMAIAPALAIVALGLLVYSNTFDAPFQWDDKNTFISENPVVRDLRCFAAPSLARGFEQYGSFKNRYVGYLTFALNYKVGGLNVRGYHAVNVAVHVLNALLLWLLVRLTLNAPPFEGSPLKARSETLALFSGLFFVSHPVQTEAVTYVFQRLASLAALFCLLSLTAYAAYRLARGGGRRRALYALSLLAALLAMKTKENSFTLPVVIALYELTFFNGPARARAARLVPFLLTMLIVPVSLAWSGVSEGDALGGLVGASRGYAGFGRVEYFVTQTRVVMTYIRLLFFPVGQNIDYDYPLLRSPFDPRALPSFMAIAALISSSVCLLRFTRVKPHAFLRLVPFGVLWFFLALSVESSIIPLPMLINEYRAYMPSAGFFVSALSAVFLFSERLKSGPARAAVLAALVAALAANSLAAYERNSLWRSEISLWEDAVRKSPAKARPHNNLGVAYKDSGLFASAEREYLTAIKLMPDMAEAHNNLGVLYRERGAYTEAIREFATALRLDPGEGEYHSNIGVAYKNIGRHEEAVREFREAIRLKPYYTEFHVNLGNALNDMGRHDEALEEFRRALEIGGGRAGTHNGIGIALAGLGRYGEAEREFRRAAELDPSYTEAHVNLGNVYESMGRYEEAMAEFRAALAINPASAEAHNNLGLVYDSMGRYEEAESEYRAALEIDPASAEAHNNLGAVRYARGDYAAAYREFQEAVRLRPDNPDFSRNLLRARAAMGGR